jgi:CubicO group peptidase (beta-lactamase class C family)
MDEQALGFELRGLVDAAERDGLFSGAVLVEREGRVVLLEARGFAHRGFGQPNRPDTLFDTASVTKLFTAAAAFRLVGRGLLGLDESILELCGVSGTRISREVTLRHCLTHSSGIADDADEEAGEVYEELWKARPSYMVRETRDFLPAFVHKEALFPAGDHVRYNNCALVLAGLALEARTGLSYREIVAAEVFGPAGMTQSAFLAKDSVGVAGREPAEGYATIEDAGGRPVGFRKNIYAFPPIGSPDAGAYTTVTDLRAFFRAIEDGSLLGAELTPLFLEAPLFARALAKGEERRQGYILEHFYDRQGRRYRYGKDGINPGVAAIAMRYPLVDGFVAILANQDCDVWDLCRSLAETAGLRPEFEP